jgi:hypothetical protein
MGGIVKRAVITAVILSMVFAAAAFAAESNEPPQGPAPSFEQRKAEVLEFLDQRITRQQQEKACVEAAKNPDELKACREKYGPPNRPGGPVRPGGPGGHGAPGGPAPPQD